MIDDTRAAFQGTVGLLIGVAGATIYGAPIVLVAVIAISAGVVFYKLSGSSWLANSAGRRADETLDPEVVREKTESMSDPVAAAPYAQIESGEDAESGPKSTRETPSAGDNGTSSSSRPESIDRSELEFEWQTETDVRIDDIGGMSDLKRTLRRNVVQPLTTHRDAAQSLGITAPNLLFWGPPGTGKTYAANALATELGLPFAQLSGADIQSKWINESATKVQELFEEAKMVAAQEGGAVIFLDEIDSVLKTRGGNANTHEEDNKVVNEFLNHLEETEEHDIVFIGATNRLDSLDRAGIRSGRIDKKIQFDHPDKQARIEILNVHLRDRPHSVTDAQVERVAKRSEQMTAADLDQLVADAARHSLFERDDDKITIEDLLTVLAE